MKIILDAMGGDNAPAAVVEGAVQAVSAYDVDVVLVGREDEVRACLRECGAAENERVSVVHAPDVIDMHDDPATAIREKKEASMTIALRMLAAGEGDAVVSAGSTGALLSGATLIGKRIRGIRRAAMAPVLPNKSFGVVLIDCGANVECTPEYLLQFAFMGSFYSKQILGCPEPKVGLLNIGTEDTKGGELQKTAFALLQKASEDGRIRFVGNVEAREVFSGDVDVLVTDGFSGNVLLKGIEGTALFLMKLIKQSLMSTIISKLGALLVGKELRKLKKLFDAGETGGTPMLGISKAVIKAHGSSDARAISSAVRQAKQFVESGVIREIENHIDDMKTA
ncbi:MAG: phosphate acyltransferase PlsX [Oscillospiraceae bacterium]|nr:phosphate acyltransferase PlsX [Oscillospiraceae bacterium]MBR6561800.1 phosphate acyltransferase PlsX [Oscillospiraceae bacterium]